MRLARAIALVLPILFSSLAMSLVFAADELSNSGRFRLTPMELVLRPSGDASTGTLRVENPSTRACRVRFEFFARGADETGQETRTPTKEIVVEPNEVVVAAQGASDVVVAFQGDTKFTSEKAFRVLATGEGMGSGQKIRLRYEASLYVAPVTAEQKLAVHSSRSVGAEAKGRLSAVEVTLENSGLAHSVLREWEPTLDWRVKSSTKSGAETSGSLALTAKSKQEWDRKTVLAQSKLVLRLTVIEPPPAGAEMVVRLERRGAVR